MGGHHMTPEEVHKHVKQYWVIFGALMGLTVVTVAISYLHLPTTMAILLALAVASVKASLVALYFMHLISEKKVIYWILALTVVIFGFCMLIAGFADYQGN